MLKGPELVKDPHYVQRVVDNLRDYGFHRNKLFMTRAMAKEAADIIEVLRGE